MGQSVLVVDDDILILDLVCFILRKELPRLKLLRADTGLGAVALYKRERPEFVFLDMKLPDTDGFAVYQTIMETGGSPVVFCMSAMLSLADQKKVVEMGAAGFFRKPFDPKSLVAALKERIE